MDLRIYYSTYIIIWGFLYWLKIVKCNPLSWLIIALITSIIIILYLVYNNVPINMLIKYIIYNSPKLLLLCLIDHNNINNGFIIGTLFFIYYLIVIDFDIKNVYFDQTIKKLLDSTF